MLIANFAFCIEMNLCSSVSRMEIPSSVGLVQG